MVKLLNVHVNAKTRGGKIRPEEKKKMKRIYERIQERMSENTARDVGGNGTC